MSNRDMLSVDSQFDGLTETETVTVGVGVESEFDQFDLQELRALTEHASRTPRTGRVSLRSSLFLKLMQKADLL